MRRQAVRLGERPDQVRGVRVQPPRGLFQGDPGHHVRVEQLAQPPGQPRIARGGSLGALVTQPLAEPLGDQREPALRVQLLPRHGNDRDNRAAVRGVPRDALDLVGIAVHGPRNAVDKVLKGAWLHS